MVLLASCTASSSDTGSAQFAVSMRQALDSNVSRVSVTSRADGIPSVTVELAPTNGVWGGVIGNIPAGANRSFIAQAFDSSDTLVFEGAVSGVTISAGQATLVAITLQQINEPLPFENEAPLIESLIASSTSVLVGGSISLQATARDPNPGDSLSYAWSSSAGSFSSSSAPATSWTAPLSTGIQKLTFTVTDSGGLSSSIALAINVIQSAGEGEAKLSISFNSSPLVASVIATPTQLAVGQRTAVSVSASDPDGDSLSYSWSATCAGTWANASSNAAQFTPSEVPAGACNNCRLIVSVSDGHEGQNTGTVALCVSNTPPINHFPPVIVRSYRSSDTAAAGQVITYEVEASDPEASALTFSWAATVGTIGTPENGASRSRLIWTAPGCVIGGANPNITATVTNAFNLTVTKSFSVAGLPVCSSSWALTGSMAVPRHWFRAAPLPGGKVLVAGGVSIGGVLATAEVYDPVSGTWSATGTMAQDRWNHTLTSLPNGRVLVAGGNYGGSPNAKAEVYDPVAGTWSATGSMIWPRRSHTATVLPNGKVLVAGGDGLATAEVYDPISGKWSATGTMTSIRSNHEATVLPNGKVLVVGGSYYENSETLGRATAEIYDPALGTWSATGSMSTPRYYATATLLLDGTVLVAGGRTANAGGSSAYLATAELYNPASGTWKATGSMPSTNSVHSATLLLDGTVLVAGGPVHAAVYDPTLGTWRNTGPMSLARPFPTATLLPGGRVLIAGGYEIEAELYTP
uniref:Kelch repeat-containing protein n=1 Tax=Archangium lipolyticum TaxID=2970465 RepID=UPI00214A8714|nr:kelch repeat-containing protein [Archangium lipolyticum]